MHAFDDELKKKLQDPAFALAFGIEHGKISERDKIVNWVRANRREFDLGEGLVIYRDGFDSEALLDFILKKEETNDEEQTKSS